MTDERRPRRPRPDSTSRPPRSRRAPAPRPEPASSPPAPVRRGRFYGIPVIGTLAYIVWPPRSGRPSIRRRVVSWVLVVVAVFGIGMAAYPVAGEHYPPGYRQAIEQLI